MNFSNKPTQLTSKNMNKADIIKTFKKIEMGKEKKIRKISKKPYKILRLLTFKMISTLTLSTGSIITR